MKRRWPTGSVDGCSNSQQIEQFEEPQWPTISTMFDRKWIRMMEHLLYEAFLSKLGRNQGTQQAGSPCWTGTQATALLSARKCRSRLENGFLGSKFFKKNIRKMYRYKNHLWCITVVLANCGQFETFRNLCIHRWIITSAWHESTWT